MSNHYDEGPATALLRELVIGDHVAANLAEARKAGSVNPHVTTVIYADWIDRASALLAEPGTSSGRYEKALREIASLPLAASYQGSGVTLNTAATIARAALTVTDSAGASPE